MKILIAYYSRTGTTKVVAERLAQELGADVDEIVDLQERLGPVNYMRAARAAKGLKTTEVRYERNPEDYDVIVIGTPIWWNNLPPAPRTYLSSFDLRGKRVAFFITSQGEERENVFSQLIELTNGADVLGTFGVLQKVVKSEDYSEALVTFLETIKVESVALTLIPQIN
jgi:flavodoxin